MNSVPRLGDVPRQLAADEFWGLFGRLEHEQLDFKRGVPKDVRDTIAAMAMTRGGLIIHGVDDSRNIVGCPLSQNTQDRIARIASECGVDVQIREIIVSQSSRGISSVGPPCSLRVVWASVPNPDHPPREECSGPLAETVAAAEISSQLVRGFAVAASSKYRSSSECQPIAPFLTAGLRRTK